MNEPKDTEGGLPPTKETTPFTAVKAEPSTAVIPISAQKPNWEHEIEVDYGARGVHHLG